jgi:hypothetical protein
MIESRQTGLKTSYVLHKAFQTSDSELGGGGVLLKKRYLEDDLLKFQKEMHLPSLAGIYDSELPNFKVTSRIIILFGPLELSSFMKYDLLVCT